MGKFSKNRDATKIQGYKKVQLHLRRCASPVFCMQPQRNLLKIELFWCCGNINPPQSHLYSKPSHFSARLQGEGVRNISLLFMFVCEANQRYKGIVNFVRLFNLNCIAHPMTISFKAAFSILGGGRTFVFPICQILFLRFPMIHLIFEQTSYTPTPKLIVSTKHICGSLFF